MHKPKTRTPAPSAAVYTYYTWENADGSRALATSKPQDQPCQKFTTNLSPEALADPDLWTQRKVDAWITEVLRLTGQERARVE